MFMNYRRELELEVNIDGHINTKTDPPLQKEKAGKEWKSR